MVFLPNVEKLSFRRDFYVKYSLENDLEFNQAFGIANGWNREREG